MSRDGEPGGGRVSGWTEAAKFKRRRASNEPPDEKVDSVRVKRFLDNHGAEARRR